MNLFGFLHRERALRQLRCDQAELLAAHEELRRQYDAVVKERDEAVKGCDEAVAGREEAVEAARWFKDRYEKQYKRAEVADGRAFEAETVVKCLEEKVAGPLTGPLASSPDAGSPIFDQVTGEYPLPTFDPDGEATIQFSAIGPVRTLADAFGGGL